MNMKEQMEVRMGKIWSEGGKVRAVMVGGSQIGRLGAEVGQKGKEAVEVEGWVKVKGRLDREEMERVVEKVLEVGKMADKVIVGGPGNSLFRHGSGEKRGFCPERTAKVERNVQGEVTRVSVEYHMTEPERVALSEKRELIDTVVELFRRIGEGLPGIQLVYITMFPRHITRCCREAGHMSRQSGTEWVQEICGERHRGGARGVGYAGAALVRPAWMGQRAWCGGACVQRLGV